MEFISTKQAAEKWGISQRRVAVLASQGRIEGAVSTGNTWIIPDNAPKPADNRRKDVKEAKKTETENYPYIICIYHSEEQLAAFSNDEKKLYRACLLQEAGEFEASAVITKALLDSDNLNVHLAALYLHALNCLYLSDYAGTEKYAFTFRQEYYSIDNPSPLLKILAGSFEADMGDSFSFVSTENNLDPSQLATDLLPYISCQQLYAKMLSSFFDRNYLDLEPYETICIMADSQGYFYSAIILNCILSIIYATRGDYDRMNSRLKRAMDISIEHNAFLILINFISTNDTTMETLFEQYPSYITDKIKIISTLYAQSRLEYSMYLKDKRSRVMNSLSKDEHRLASMCLYNYTISKMSEVLGLSRSGINRRLSKLYQKLGVDSQAEMKKLYLDAMLNWEKD